jgi:putative endonuclease
MFYVYVLKSLRDGKLYFGYTKDLKKRINAHDAGLNKSTKYRGKLELVYYEAYKSRADAEAREFRLKHSAGAYTALKRRIPLCLR